VSRAMSESAKVTRSNIFDVVRRGYDPQQVDDHMRTLLTQLSQAQKAHQHEQRRARWIESELKAARAALERQDPDQGSQQGFGYRVEKLLRTAEHEATEVRSSASREATVLLEQARKEAESHRHDVEQALITRITALDQQATQRKVELDERERYVAEQTAAARAEAERIIAQVQRRAEQLHREATVLADRARHTAEKIIRDRHESAVRDLNRLSALRAEVRGELSRLLDVLANEFGDQRETPRRRADRPHPAPGWCEPVPDQQPLPAS